MVRVCRIFGEISSSDLLFPASEYLGHVALTAAFLQPACWKAPGTSTSIAALASQEPAVVVHVHCVTDDGPREAAWTCGAQQNDVKSRALRPLDVPFYIRYTRLRDWISGCLAPPGAGVDDRRNERLGLGDWRPEGRWSPEEEGVGSPLREEERSRD